MQGNNTYNIKNARLSEKNRTCSFEFVDGQFRMFVKGSYTPDPFRVCVHPVKMTFLSEDVLSIGGAGPYNMKPVFRTESYTLPLSMLEKFFDMLRRQWQDGRERTLSTSGVEDFMAALYKAGEECKPKRKRNGSKQTRR